MRADIGNTSSVPSARISIRQVPPGFSSDVIPDAGEWNPIGPNHSASRSGSVHTTDLAGVTSLVATLGCTITARSAPADRTPHPTVSHTAVSGAIVRSLGSASLERSIW